MSPLQSVRCSNCNSSNRTEDLYCLNCGYILPHAVNQPTDKTRNFASTSSHTIDLQWGTGYFHHRARLFLRLDETEVIIPVPLYSPSVIIGRNTDTSSVGLDLTIFNAGPLGVSRQHARIDRRRDVLQITDMDSANGTFLNRDRLAPGVPHTLRNRAVLQLGKMILRVQFA